MDFMTPSHVPATVWHREIYGNPIARPLRGTALTTDDWIWLNAGDRVRVQRENEIAATGSIDVVSGDASIFWVWLDDGRGRVALHMEAKVSVWLE
ncbi:hypothetical protein [Paenarthrobacter sp. NPDC058040]|uniref:hypothetical protein n=1 Tax=unclassified Paenarthrobacter TaxID=2634190 RepID=UPI0036D9C679